MNIRYEDHTETSAFFVLRPYRSQSVLVVGTVQKPVHFLFGSMEIPEFVVSSRGFMWFRVCVPIWQAFVCLGTNRKL